MGDKEATGADAGVKYLALGIGIGALIGLAAGLLFAPKPGEETRAELGEALSKASNRAKEKLNEVKCKVEGAVENRRNEMGDKIAAEQAGDPTPVKEQG